MKIQLKALKRQFEVVNVYWFLFLIVLANLEPNVSSSNLFSSKQIDKLIESGKPIGEGAFGNVSPF